MAATAAIQSRLNALAAGSEEYSPPRSQPAATLREGVEAPAAIGCSDIGDAPSPSLQPPRMRADSAAMTDPLENANRAAALRPTPTQHVAKLHAEVTTLQQEAEAREYIVADLRRQVGDLLLHKQEAAALRRQLQLLDERVRARDLAQQARVEEMAAKLKLHETVESQLEAQVMRVEEERLATQKRLGEQVAAAEARVTEAQAAHAELGAQMQSKIEASVAEAEAARKSIEGELHEERARTAELRSQARDVAHQLGHTQKALGEAQHR